MLYAGGEAARVHPGGTWRVWCAFHTLDDSTVREGWGPVGSYHDALAWLSIVPFVPVEVTSEGRTHLGLVTRARIVPYSH